jgi:hypothetical protein
MMRMHMTIPSCHDQWVGEDIKFAENTGFSLNVSVIYAFCVVKK